MRNHELHHSISAGEQDRRDGMHPRNRLLGRVVACGGARATIAAIAESGTTDLTELWSVGRLISISVGRNRVVALTCSMSTGSQEWSEGQDNEFRIEVELLGEVHVGPDGREEFSRGISNYPHLGAIAHRIRSADLMRIYDTGKSDTCVIGKLTQDDSIDATIHIPSMLSKHFAIVGSTGVGKSTAVSLLLHKAIDSDPKLRVLILDPHNEFAAAFPDKAVVIDTDTLDLPFWLMRLEEFAEVLFRGRPPVADELDILRDLIPEAKRAFRGNDNSLMRRSSEKKLRYGRHAGALSHCRSAGADRREDRPPGGTRGKAVTSLAEGSHHVGYQRSALSLHVLQQHDQRHDHGDDRAHFPHSRRRQADLDVPVGRHPV